MRRLSLIFGLLAFLAGAGQALPSSAQRAASTLAFAPTGDAYVTSAARRRNFGSAKVLRVQGRPIVRSYVRFNLTGVEGPVARATLRVFVRTGARLRLRAQASGSRWSERRITFANAPRPAGAAAASGAVRSRSWISVDVTSLVRVNGPLSIALSGSGGALSLASRESGATRPQLLVDVTPPPTLTAAGDIASCDLNGDEQTAALVDTIGGSVAALGDLAYDNGTAAEFASCYQPSWGRFKARTHPAPGNHEYGPPNPGAAPYFDYWGGVAGAPGQGWYSYDLGAWHIVSLNSNCTLIGGCQAGSPQYSWLQADLAAHRTACTLAYSHHPLYSGTADTEEPRMFPIWQLLYDNNADVVLAGHAHNYQRFAPQSPLRVPNPARGLREFVVGTGGKTLRPAVPIANTEVVNSDTFGVLKLTLRNSGYDWQFLPIAGQTFTDSGSHACH